MAPALIMSYSGCKNTHTSTFAEQVDKEPRDFNAEAFCIVLPLTVVRIGAAAVLPALINSHTIVAHIDQGPLVRLPSHLSNAMPFTGARAHL